MTTKEATMAISVLLSVIEYNEKKLSTVDTMAAVKNANEKILELIDLL